MEKIDQVIQSIREIEEKFNVIISSELGSGEYYAVHDIEIYDTDEKRIIGIYESEN